MNAACPYALYLGRLAPNSQRSIASQLNSIADMMGWTCNPPIKSEQF